MSSITTFAFSTAIPRKSLKLESPLSSLACSSPCRKSARKSSACKRRLSGQERAGYRKTTKPGPRCLYLAQFSRAPTFPAAHYAFVGPSIRPAEMRMEKSAQPCLHLAGHGCQRSACVLPAMRRRTGGRPLPRHPLHRRTGEEPAALGTLSGNVRESTRMWIKSRRAANRRRVSHPLRHEQRQRSCISACRWSCFRKRRSRAACALAMLELGAGVSSTSRKPHPSGKRLTKCSTPPIVKKAAEISGLPQMRRHQKGAARRRFCRFISK